ncbi:hypothetical protein FMM74_020760 [Lachnospiraceae bacterium MD308]|nr:hypothetical protein [Lachnospiraceae bacterium MD308]
MKMFEKDTRKGQLVRGTIYMEKEHRGPGKHILPHERKGLMRIEFEENDWDLFQMIYGDEDEAVAAVQVLMDAPPEIQILAVQLINLIEEVE